jgi:serine/threonine protein kinase
MAGVIPKKFSFESVKLLKESCLGTGSYGSVYKAECNGLICAAKLLHPTLFTPDTQQVDSHRAHRLPSRRFEQECELLSAIQHPNIIQYLGTWTDPSTNLPVLLMELMDESLTHFLEKPNTPPLPLHTQVSICHDISLALSFLHSNGIIHRDLTSNNILMLGERRAKVTDFGMAKLKEFDRKDTSTLCPGTLVYMPPEALAEVPKSSEKTDCFSFGVICIQIITKLYPAPSQQYKETRSFFRKYFELQSELKRRHDHLILIPRDHPLLKTIQDCLKDIDAQRPSSGEICRTISSIKETTKHAQSLRAANGQNTKKQIEKSVNQAELPARKPEPLVSFESDIKDTKLPIESTSFDSAIARLEAQVSSLRVSKGKRQVNSGGHAVTKNSEVETEEQLEAKRLLMDLEDISCFISDLKTLNSEESDELDAIEYTGFPVSKPKKVDPLDALQDKVKEMQDELRHYI